MYNSDSFTSPLSPQSCRSSHLPSCQGTVVDQFSKTGQSVGRVLTKLSSGGVAPPFAWLAPLLQL